MSIFFFYMPQHKQYDTINNLYNYPQNSTNIVHRWTDRLQAFVRHNPRNDIGNEEPEQKPQPFSQYLCFFSFLNFFFFFCRRFCNAYLLHLIFLLSFCTTHGFLTGIAVCVIFFPTAIRNGTVTAKTPAWPFFASSAFFRQFLLT